MEKVKARAWCFTLNNYTEEEETKIKNSSYEYLLIGHEVGELGTPHLQGYIYFKTSRNFGGVKKLLGIRCHLEKAQGGTEANYRYCTKSGNFWEGGTKPAQGKRNDIEEIKEAISDGRNISEVINIASGYQGMRAAELLMKYQKHPAKILDKQVIWLWGATGTGKTRMAIQYAEEQGYDYWISSRDLRWWNGYYGQEYVILDDFRGDFCKYHELLRIIDKTPYMCETKGSAIWLRAKIIVVTSCFTPQECYLGVNEDKRQLMRRITEVICLGTEVPGTEVGGNTPPDFPKIKSCEEE